MQPIENMCFPWWIVVVRGWAFTKVDFMAEFDEVDIHRLLFKPSRNSTTMPTLTTLQDEINR